MIVSPSCIYLRRPGPDFIPRDPVMPLARRALFPEGGYSQLSLALELARKTHRAPSPSTMEIL